MNKTAMKSEVKPVEKQVIPAKTPFIYRNIFAYFVLFLSFGLGGSIYLALARVKEEMDHGTEDDILSRAIKDIEDILLITDP